MLIVGSKEFMDESKDELPELPARTVLHQNYPNPFSPSTIVRYNLAHSCSVRLTIYDTKGIYFSRLKTISGFRQTQKMLLIR